MTNKTEKGTGIRVQNQLTAEQKVKLTLWLNSKSESCKETYEELAELASNELGFHIVPCNVSTIWTAMYGKRRVKNKESVQRIKDLEKRIERIERELGL